MSDISETIDRLEQWVEHWAPHYPEEFIADLRALLNTAKAAQRAAELLESEEDVTVTMDEDGGSALMVCAFVVDHAVAILKGECKE